MSTNITPGRPAAPAGHTGAARTEPGHWTGPRGGWAYERYGGAGLPVLLLHGMMFDRAMWRPVAGDLGRDHRVVAVDLPGHGDSPPRDGYRFDAAVDELAALSADLGLDRPLVVGHSAGALLATWYAARHPVRGVVNVDQPLDIRELAGRLRQAGTAGLTDAGYAGLVDLLVASMRLDAVPERYRSLVTPRPVRTVLVGWQQELLAREPAVAQAVLEERARRISAPYLTVLAREPWPAYADWQRDLIPTSRCTVYDVAGHFPHLAQVTRFSQAVRELGTDGTVR